MMITNNQTEKLLTVADVMERLGVSRRTAQRLLSDKRCPTLPRCKGGKYMITEAGWVAYMMVLSRPGR